MKKQFCPEDIGISATKISLNQSIERTILDIIQENADNEDPFFVVDLTKLVMKVSEWFQLLPRVEPFYAIKCNPNIAIVKTLALCGVRFDCASKGEIESVLKINGVTEDSIIYANPCKPKAHITFAKKSGVKMMTFDNADELAKIKSIYSDANLVLRIITDDSHSVCRFNAKYGCPLDSCEELLRESLTLGLKVIGVSFHVGSECNSVESYKLALRNAKKVFDLAKSIGIEMNLLDIGGGFPGSMDDSHVNFSEIAMVINEQLDELFTKDIRVIAEPGRFFATSCCTLATSVIARRKVVNTECGDSSKEMYLYYINDGVYGSFNNLMYDHAIAKPLDLLSRPASHLSTIFGPTCDSLDCLVKDELLPYFEVGDWIYFKDMGAYTIAAASNFNGFNTPRIHYVYS